jgi:hypothetical protein
VLLIAQFNLAAVQPLLVLDFQFDLYRLHLIDSVDLIGRLPMCRITSLD